MAPMQKKQKKKQEEHHSRLLPCPFCHRSFPSYFLNDHANFCLDTPTPLPISNISHISKTRGDHDLQSQELGLTSSDAWREEDEEAMARRSVRLQEDDRSVQEVLVQRRRNVEERCEAIDKTWDEVSKLSANGLHASLAEEWDGDQERKSATTVLQDGGQDGIQRVAPALQFVQMQKQSQAKLYMLGKFSMSAALERKPSVTVLQSGMVLLRSWVSLDIQQRLVHESQSSAHLFHRPSTAGGGKYHIYSMSWGCQWDSKTRQYAAHEGGQPLPGWMFDLAQELASDAQQHSPVYQLGSVFTPDVALVNFYPVKAKELGVVGLGGHQDLDDYLDMPVVSISVGDSMTFFFRRIPPLSRRKSGVQVLVDQVAAKDCEDGDTAHNGERKVILESGDILVFGGLSRLVYHGTRNVQPGTRPPGLHMVPGRLNFTFRQCNARKNLVNSSVSCSNT
ncbi:hypothetical protein BDL97_04G039000 [Sphagnum fallax]|nr:hypothetical protein BDL97_04G039000 [Sphagnum fallax]KAH8963968.1 hypothetical protein BDL97_04G039000 [Sphagnum fallax]